MTATVSTLRFDKVLSLVSIDFHFPSRLYCSVSSQSNLPTHNIWITLSLIMKGLSRPKGSNNLAVTQPEGKQNGCTQQLRRTHLIKQRHRDHSRVIPNRCPCDLHPHCCRKTGMIPSNLLPT